MGQDKFCFKSIQNKLKVSHVHGLFAWNASFVAFEVLWFLLVFEGLFDSSLFAVFARSHQESGCLEFGHETLYWHILPPMNNLPS